MKDKTQKSFRGIVRILLLVFCYTFGSHAFALALEHEQTVDIYKVTDVPNPRNESSSNWVSNPNQILDESYVWEINNMLSQLEDSLSIEVTVVALPSIGEDIPAEFAHKLFEHWGIGKKADDNGLLILLVLDQRKVTFATGYGLEGVLPDALCFRIQQNEMVPWFRKNDFDRGITEGVRAVTLVLYGSDYEPVSQGTSDNYWKSASNTLWNFLANQPLMLWIFLIVSVSAILSCRPFFGNTGLFLCYRNTRTKIRDTRERRFFYEKQKETFIRSFSLCYDGKRLSWLCSKSSGYSQSNTSP